MIDPDAARGGPVVPAARRPRPGPLALVAGPGAFGGAQRYLLSLLAQLPAALDRDVVLLAQEPTDRTLLAGARATGCHVRVLPAGDAAAAALAGAVDAVDAGAVHLNATDPHTEAPLLRAAVDTGLPVSATVHMTDRWAPAPAPADLPALLGATVVVLAPSRDIAEHLVVAHGAPAERVVHVPNGVAVPGAPAATTAATTAGSTAATPPSPIWGAGSRAQLRVACLARLTRQKGLDVLVDAVAALPAGTVEFVVAGTGREEAALRTRSAGLPITWAGFAPDPSAVLAGAQAYVQPSREDALPLALLEAAAAGLPCVATRVGDVAEHLGGALLLVEPEDAAALAAALTRLASDPALRRELGAAARRRVLAQHTEGALAQRTASVLRRAWAAPVREAV